MSMPEAKDEKSAPKNDGEKKTEPKRIPLREIHKENLHEIGLKGKKIKYKSIVETILLKDEFEEPRGGVFTVAYLKQGSNAQKRPLMFSSMGAQVHARHGYILEPLDQNEWNSTTMAFLILPPTA